MPGHACPSKEENFRWVLTGWAGLLGLMRLRDSLDTHTQYKELLRLHARSPPRCPVPHTRAPFHIHFTLVMISSHPHLVGHPRLRLSILDLFAMPLACVLASSRSAARLLPASCVASTFRPSDYKVYRVTFINSSYEYIPFYPFSLSLFDCRSTARPLDRFPAIGKEMRQNEMAAQRNRG